MEKEVSSVVKIRFSDCDPIGHLNNVKYLEYMLNAREDHVEEFYGFTYEDYFRRTGCTWVAVQNEIAYLKEVKANTKVVISSKTIEMSDRVSKVEILMKDENEKVYFHLKRNYKWKDFKFHYEIALEEDLDAITLLSIIHVVNYFSSQDDGSAATTAATV